MNKKIVTGSLAGIVATLGVVYTTFKEPIDALMGINQPEAEVPSVSKTVGDIKQGGDQTTTNGNNEQKNDAEFNF